MVCDGAGVIEVHATDYHTAGEPFRIVRTGVPEVTGASVAERRLTAINDDRIDAVRRLVCHEPRGHADMYGCFLVPPDDNGADLGALFWHRDGFSTACGHGTIALGAWAVESGVVASDPNGLTDVVVDVPSGRVLARVRCAGGVVHSVVFRNVAAHVVKRNVVVSTERGLVHVDVAFAGALYASAPADAVGLSVHLDHYADLIAVGREVKWAVDAMDLARHSSTSGLSGCYGTIWFDDLGDDVNGPRQRNVTIFADGVVDRSPCGSGTSARAALLDADGRLGDGRTLTHTSIIGTRFTAWIHERLRTGRTDAVIVDIEGMAYRTAEHRFVLGPHDRLGTGFVLR